MFTYEELQDIVPKKQKALITEDMVTMIAEIASDPLCGDEFKNNMVSYSSVLGSGKYSLTEYSNATQFVTLLMLEHKDIDAYKIVFPERYLRLTTKGLSRSQISAYATNFKKTQLVSQILEQTMIPTHILNAPLYQEALNHSRYLMLNARSETVQQKAAETIMTQLKAPEASKLEIDISVNKADVVNENEDFMREIAKQKLELMALGGDVHQITNMTVSAEVIDVEEEKC